jgi:hypothetical protein
LSAGPFCGGVVVVPMTCVVVVDAPEVGSMMIVTL